MGLEDIKTKIISDAEAKKDEMIKSAQTKRDEVIGESKRKADDYRSEIMDQAKEEGVSLKRGIVIDARLKLKNEVLNKKRDSMENVFTSALQQFMDSAEYPKMMTALVKSVVSSGSEQIIVSDKEKKLDKKWLDDLNKAAGAKLTFSDEKGKFMGGVIVKEGRTFVNITVETLLNTMREDVERDVANILFKA